MRSARGQIGEIEKIAGKEVRRSRRSRIKEEKQKEAAAVRQEKRRESREAHRQWFAKWKESLKKKRQENEPSERQAPEVMEVEPWESPETQAPENLEMQAGPEEIPMQEDLQPVTEAGGDASASLTDDNDADENLEK